MFAYRNNTSQKEVSLWKYFLVALIFLIAVLMIMFAIKRDPNAPIILSDNEIDRALSKTSREPAIIISEGDLKTVLAQKSPPTGSLILSDADLARALGETRRVETN